jgi:hypothetical protein
MKWPFGATAIWILYFRRESSPSILYGRAANYRLATNVGAARRASRARVEPAESPMLDVIFLVAGLAFFGLAMLYVVACDRL